MNLRYTNSDVLCSAPEKWGVRARCAADLSIPRRGDARSAFPATSAPAFVLSFMLCAPQEATLVMELFTCPWIFPFCSSLFPQCPSSRKVGAGGAACGVPRSERALSYCKGADGVAPSCRFLHTHNQIKDPQRSGDPPQRALHSVPAG